MAGLFQGLFRELATIFRTRIELHQTTGRDESKTDWVALGCDEINIAVAAS
jgi:cell fate regulator YaaT (PSP1 superfamily)